MHALRSKSLLLTGYAEQLLGQIAERTQTKGEYPFQIITPTDPRQRGTQLSVLLKEGLLEGVSAALEENGIICDKRKPGCIRVAPVPLYNTFSDVWRFMQTLEKAVAPQVEKTSGSTEARL
jgi:kynureninase